VGAGEAGWTADAASRCAAGVVGAAERVGWRGVCVTKPVPVEMTSAPVVTAGGPPWKWRVARRAVCSPHFQSSPACSTAAAPGDHCPCPPDPLRVLGSPGLATRSTGQPHFQTDTGLLTQKVGADCGKWCVMTWQARSAGARARSGRERAAPAGASGSRLRLRAHASCGTQCSNNFLSGAMAVSEPFTSRNTRRHLKIGYR
jgi:hypothetical protein